MLGFWMPLTLAAFGGFMLCASYQHAATAFRRGLANSTHTLFAVWSAFVAALSFGNLGFYLDIGIDSYFVLSKVQVFIAECVVLMLLLFSAFFLQITKEKIVKIMLVAHVLLLMSALLYKGGGFAWMNPEDIYRATDGMMQGRLIVRKIVPAWPMYLFNLLLWSDYALAFYWGFRRYASWDSSSRVGIYLLALGFYMACVMAEAIVYAISGQISYLSLLGIGSMVIFMGGSLSSAEQEREVIQLNRALEQRVVERTRELEQTLWSLSQEMADKDALNNQLIQAQKMEAVGQLAAGFVHDFNNTLTAIRAYAELAVDEVERGSEVNGYLRQLMRATDKGAQLTAQLQQFASHGQAERKPCQLEDIVESYIAKHPLDPASRIHLAIAAAAGLPSVRVDPHNIAQMLFHLVNNARHTMPDGGELMISLDSASGRDVPLTLPQADYVRLSISASARDVENKRNTSSSLSDAEGNEKTDLGLAVCYGLARVNDCHIVVSSESGKGSRFDLYFVAGVTT